MFHTITTKTTVGWMFFSKFQNVPIFIDPTKVLRFYKYKQ